MDERLNINKFMFKNYYNKKRVLITGHTGFKGSWLVSWLLSLGAEVAGFSNKIPTEPSHWKLLNLESSVRNYIGDIRNKDDIENTLKDFKPQIIFHLAAQALVKDSINDPIYTFETNAIGMVNILSAIHKNDSVEVVVLITSDKAYENKEWVYGYREFDALAGHDPYSASKSCADIIASSYYYTFFQERSLKLGIARAGNVIGGGDWAKDRIIPDCIRSWTNSEQVIIRSPNSTRPWQHVLEPLSGYLSLGEKLGNNYPNINGEAFNFGPDSNVNETVLELLHKIKQKWSIANWKIENQNGNNKEANLLKLSCDKALHYLNWCAILSIDETIDFTVSWYKNWLEKSESIHAFTFKQISQYEKFGSSKKISWSKH